MKVIKHTPIRSSSSLNPFRRRTAGATHPFISAKTVAPPAKTTPSSSTWTQLKDTALALYAKGNQTAAAKQAYQKAIHFAIAKMTPPPGIKWVQPNPGDIQIDFGLTYAQTKGAEVERHPDNYWKWIYFGAGAISETPFFTEAITYHELVHVVQYKASWFQYQIVGEVTTLTWTTFRKLYGEVFFTTIPEEMEAHITSLTFLGRVDFSKKETAYLHQGLFVSLLGMYNYVNQTGKQHEKLVVYRDKILAYFYKSKKQEEMSSVFWSMLMREPLPRPVLKQALKDLWALAKPAYIRPGFKKLYDKFLSHHGITVKIPKPKPSK